MSEWTFNKKKIMNRFEQIFEARFKFMNNIVWCRSSFWIFFTQKTKNIENYRDSQRFSFIFSRIHVNCFEYSLECVSNFGSINKLIITSANTFHGWCHASMKNYWQIHNGNNWQKEEEKKRTLMKPLWILCRNLIQKFHFHCCSNNAW